MIGSPNLDNPAAPNGGNYGVIGALAGNANTGVTGIPLVENQVVFTFDGWTSTELPNLTNVHLCYGTAMEGTSVPEPMTLLLLGLGLMGIAGVGRKFKK